MKRSAWLLIAMAVPLAACGGDDDSSTTTAAAAATTAPAAGASTTTAADTPTTVAGGPTTTAAATEGPVTSGQATIAADGSITVEHLYGTTTVAAAPERIVSLDTQWTDVLVALDAPLVGAARDPYVPDGDGLHPWQVGEIPDAVTPIQLDPSGTILPFEAVAALQPDLIVVSWGATDQAAYDQLSAIAPTIPLLAADRQVDLWPDQALVAGALVGDPSKGEALIADADAGVAALAAELPGLAGKTYAFVNYVAGSAITIVVDPDDGAAQLFAGLGLSIDPELLAIDEAAVGRVDISLERIDELDADLLIMLTNGTPTADIIGFDALPAVQSGAFAVLDYSTAVALNTPTPRSVPYALDAIRPALEAAAA